MGVIDGLMTTFLDVDSVVVEQVVPMTRFTIRTSVSTCNISEGWEVVQAPKFGRLNPDPQNGPFFYSG